MNEVNNNDNNNNNVPNNNNLPNSKWSPEKTNLEKSQEEKETKIVPNKKRQLAIILLVIIIISILGLSTTLVINYLDNHSFNLFDKKEDRAKEDSQKDNDDKEDSDDDEEYTRLPIIKPDPATYLGTFIKDHTLDITLNNTEYKVFIYYYNDNGILQKEAYLNDEVIVPATEFSTHKSADIEALIDEDITYTHLEVIKDKKTKEEYLGYLYKKASPNYTTNIDEEIMSLTVHTTSPELIGSFEAGNLSNPVWLYTQDPKDRLTTKYNNKDTLYKGPQNYHAQIEFHDDYFYLLNTKYCSSSISEYLYSYENKELQFDTTSYDINDKEVVDYTGTICQ